MRDVDAWGAVWHGNYFGFCDEARAEVLRAFDLEPGTLFARGLVAPVIEASCRFHAPARYDDEIDVHVRARLGRGTRLCFDFAICRAADGALLTEVSTTQVLVKTGGDLVYLVPEDVGAALGRILAAQAHELPLPDKKVRP
jgi:acyl-CoA thioester hydrolase